MVPLGAILIYLVSIIGLWVVGLVIIRTAIDIRVTIVSIVILIIVTIVPFFIMMWYYSSTASGKRAWKSQESNFGNGIQRKVEVYSVDGKLLKEYEGKFDIEYDDDRILFDDENGRRHIIYYPTGTVIVDEVE